MSKIREWLIKRLGGYQKPEPREFVVIRTTTLRPRELILETYADNTIEEIDRDQYIRVEIANCFAKRLIEDGFIAINKTIIPEENRTHYRAKVTILEPTEE